MSKNVKVIFNEEQAHLTKTYNLLEDDLKQLKEKVKLPSYLELNRDTNIEDRAEIFRQREFFSKASILTNNKIKLREQLLEEVYFSRIDLLENNKPVTYYVSKNMLSSIGTIDWRSNIGELIYDNTTSSYNGSPIILKRMFDIKRNKLINFNDIKVDNIRELTDEYLISVLEDKKNDKHVTDIIKTIQKVQNEIIRLPYDYSTAVIGCAGSGKTMILMHHLSYLKFHTDKSWDKVFIITPNDKFKNAFLPLMNQLEINDIKMMTMTEYYIFKLKNIYNIDLSTNILNDEFAICNDDLSKIYSIETQSALINLYNKDVKNFYSKHKDLFRSKTLTEENCVNYIANNHEKIKNYLDNLISKRKERLNDRKHAVTIIEYCLTYLLEFIELTTIPLSDDINNEYKQLLSVVYQDFTSEFQQNYSLDYLSKLNYTTIANYYNQFISSSFKDKSFSGWKLRDDINNKESLNKFFSRNYKDIYNLLSLKKDNDIPSNDNVILFFNKPTNFLRKSFTWINNSDHFLNTKLNDQKEIKQINNIKKDLNNCIGINWYEERFIKDIINPILKDKDTANKYQFYYYYLLFFNSIFTKKINETTDVMVCIDEFQDLSPYEIDLLNTLNPKVTLNLYGDFDQCINGKGFKSKEDLPKNCHEYYLKNNYRNTIQITNYYNEKTNRNDISIGCDGDKVEKINYSEFIKSDFKENDVLICSNKHIDKLMKEKLSLEIKSVFEVKGLEYNTVYVLDDEMTRNEKYISYSRALSKLVVVETEKSEVKQEIIDKDIEDNDKNIINPENLKRKSLYEKIKDKLKQYF